MNCKKFLRIFLIWGVVLSTTITNVVAVSPFAAVSDGLFRGVVTTDGSSSKRVELENIEIQVYSAFDTQTLGDGITMYNKDYKFSVFTDEHGMFSLQKPTGDFELMIQVDTIPAGYSVDCHAKRYSSSATTGYFTLLNTVNDSPKAESVDRTVFTNLFAEANDLSASYQTTEVLLSESEITIFGSVEKDGKNTPVSHTFSLAENNPLTIIDELYNAEIISKTQQITQYCNILDMDMVGEVTCLNPILSELQFYSNTIENHSSQELLTTEEISAYNRVVATIAELRAKPSGVDSAPVESAHFDVYYDDSVISWQTAKEVSDFLEVMYTTVVAEGFRTPLLEAGKERIEVSLTPNDGEGNVAGANAATWPSTSYGNRCAGYIHVYNFTTLTSGWKETIAHEFFHLVQYAYRRTETDFLNCKWLYESTAVWFSVKYSGYANRALDKLNYYLTDDSNDCSSNRYLFNNDATWCYQAGPYFMTIDIEYGGTEVIERIWYNCAASSASLNTITGQTAITAAIGYCSSSGGSYIDAYKKMAIHITYPQYHYRNILPDNFNWTNNNSGIALGTRSNQILFNFGCEQLRYKDNTNNRKTLTVTFEFDSGQYNSYAVSRNTSGYYLYNSPVTSNAATITIPGFGDNTKDVFILLMNTSTTSNSLYNVTATAA